MPPRSTASSRSTRTSHQSVRRRRVLAVAALAVLGVVAALVVVASRGGESAREARGPGVERLTVGRGALSADVLRRPGAPAQRAVIFLHGWRLLGRAAYRDWQLRLARRGLTVVAPRYQERQGTPPEDALENALAGIRAALREVPVRRDGVFVVGHSAGAALAADYAAVAARERLPRALAVLAIYPGRIIRATSEPIPQVDPALIPSTVRLVVMASATDQIVGEQPARELFAAASAIPTSRRSFLQVRDRVAGDHFAPVLGSRTARRTFWRQLDRLLGSSR
jgi:acetyl esterase/lipase